MKSQLRAIVVAAAMLGHSAMAADYPIYPVSPPLYRPPVRNMLFSWTSCYLGGNLGAKWGNRGDTIELAAVPFPGGTIPSFSVPLQGQSVGSFIGGGQAGCNYQIGNVVLGIEGDGEGQHWDSGRQFGVLSTGVFSDNGTGTPPTTLEALSRWQAPLRGRIGYAWDRILIYATGGISWTHVRVCSNPGAFLFPLATPGCDSQTFPGGTHRRRRRARVPGEQLECRRGRSVHDIRNPFLQHWVAGDLSRAVPIPFFSDDRPPEALHGGSTLQAELQVWRLPILSGLRSSPFRRPDEKERPCRAPHRGATVAGNAAIGQFRLAHRA